MIYCRGLHYDVEKGLFLKVDSFHQIQLGTVYRKQCFSYNYLTRKSETLFLKLPRLSQVSKYIFNFILRIKLCSAEVERSCQMKIFLNCINGDTYRSTIQVIVQGCIVKEICNDRKSQFQSQNPCYLMPQTLIFHTMKNVMSNS